MAMGRRVTINAGDSTSSIAFERGLFPETVWQHPENAKLRSLRKDPNILLPGDELFVPDRSERVEHCATNATHTFVRRGIPEFFRLKVLDLAGKPWPNAPYRWKSESGEAEGRTDGQGNLEQRILPSDRSARLVVGTPPEVMELEVQLGRLDPIESLSGVRQRFANLGIEVDVDGDGITPALQRATRAFRFAHRLPKGAHIDDELRDQLKKVHGC